MNACTRLFCAFLLFGSSPSAPADSELSVHRLTGHGGPVNSVAVSPDGRQLISGSLDYAVMLWDIDSPKAKAAGRLIRHRGAVSEVLFLPSGQQAISAGDDGIINLWDTTSHKLLHQFSGHSAKIVSLDISADARFLASASWDGSVRLWDLKQRKPLQDIQVHEQTVHAVLVSDDGRQLYSGGFDGRIRHYDATNGQMVNVLHEHGWPVNIMRWLPGKRQIIFGTSNGDVQLLDLSGNGITKVLIPHFKPVLGLAVAESHGLLASGGNDGIIRVWNIDDWSLAGQTEGIPGPVWALDFSADGQGLYFGSLDDSISFWPISTEDNTQWAQGPKQRRFQVKQGLPPGELQFARKCSVCHNLKHGKTNRAGPNLFKLLGRKAGSLPDYPYSAALKHSSLVWNRETIDRLFAEGPNAVVPGSKMPLQKIPDAGKRAALIEFLVEH